MQKSAVCVRMQHAAFTSVSFPDLSDLFFLVNIDL
jgi:hypothetical protein